MQKTVLKNPLSTSLAISLIQTFPLLCYVFYIFILLDSHFMDFFYLYSFKSRLFAEMLYGLFNTLLILLILWLLIRKFIFKLEIKEEGLKYRTEIGLSGLIPWQSIKRFSMHRSLILKRRFDICWEKEGKGKSLNFWAVTAWQNLEFINQLAEKSNQPLPENWERFIEKANRSIIWCDYAINGVIFSILIIQTLFIYPVYKLTELFTFQITVPVLFLDLIVFIILLWQLLFNYGYQNKNAKTRYGLLFLFSLLSLYFFYDLYLVSKYSFGQDDFYGIGPYNESFNAIPMALSIAGGLYAALYPLWHKTHMNRIKSLLPLCIVTGLLIWLLPQFKFPVPQKDHIAYFNKDRRIHGIVTFKDGSTIMLDNTSQPPRILAYKNNREGKELAHINAPGDVYGMTLSPDKSVLLIDVIDLENKKDIQTNTVIRYDSKTHSLKNLVTHTFLQKSEYISGTPYNMFSWQFRDSAQNIWSADGRKAAFFRTAGFSVSSSLVSAKSLFPKSLPFPFKKDMNIYEVKGKRIMDLSVYDRDKDECQTLSKVTGIFSQPFWLNDGSLGFFKAIDTTEKPNYIDPLYSSKYKYDWQLIQIPLSALTSANPMKNAKTISWSTGCREINVSPFSRWAYGYEFSNPIVFTELTSGQYAQVTVNFPEHTWFNGDFRPGTNQFTTTLVDNYLLNSRIRLYSLDNPGNPRQLIKSSGISGVKWLNQRYFYLVRYSAVYLVDVETMKIRCVFPFRTFNPFAKRYVPNCYFSYLGNQDSNYLEYYEHSPDYSKGNFLLKVDLPKE
jgi:hypothetical protein